MSLVLSVPLSPIVPGCPSVPLSPLPVSPAVFRAAFPGPAVPVSTVHGARVALCPRFHVCLGLLQYMFAHVPNVFAHVPNALASSVHGPSGPVTTVPVFLCVQIPVSRPPVSIVFVSVPPDVPLVHLQYSIQVSKSGCPVSLRVPCLSIS